MLRFETPIALLLVLLTPLVFEPEWRRAVLALLRLRPKTGFVPAFNFASFAAPETLAKSWRCRLHPAALSMLKGTSFLLFVLALARPQAGSEFIDTESGGRDIMLVLDTSGSMQAVDFFIDSERVRRLDALKSVVRSFVEERTGDRLGLVVFGTNAYTQCPLTLDHRILQDYIDNLEIGMAGDSTSLGEALALAVKRIKDIKADSKTIVLVTDGKQTSGNIAPLEAADAASSHRIKVHTVGIGTNEPVPFKTKNIFGIDTLAYQEVPLDEETLTNIAQRTGGRYFNAKNTEELAQIYGEINKLEERREASPDYVEYEELFIYPAALAMLLFLVQQTAAAVFFRAIP
ncbi:MAG TPA: VWA domain-containing protein [Oligoflexia bacterium]|mgnify:CR=1 FL=1|nr:VWA domain-containing protein [Oligoflexia bacterium]